jgi:dienelactone hydrolase
MNVPEWLKPAIYGTLIGAISIIIIGFTWGGWVTGETADQRSSARARIDVVASMVPVCLEIARIDPKRMDKLATIRAASTIYLQRDALMAAGWATIPGAVAPDLDIAQACLKMLKL